MKSLFGSLMLLALCAISGKVYAFADCPPGFNPRGQLAGPSDSFGYYTGDTRFETEFDIGQSATSNARAANSELATFRANCTAIGGLPVDEFIEQQGSSCSYQSQYMYGCVKFLRGYAACCFAANPLPTGEPGAGKP